MENLRTDFFKYLFQDFNLTLSEIRSLENNINVLESHLDIVRNLDIDKT